MAYNNFNLTQSNPYLPFMQEQPQAMFNAFIPQTGNQNFLDYWKSQYGNQYGNYMGQLGRQALSGNAPTLNFEDYLSQFPFMQQWYSMNPSQRGERTASGYNWRV